MQAGDLPRPVAAGDALLAPVGLGSTEVENLRWSDDFALPYGCDGGVLAIAIAANGDIYLGGGFRSCANVMASGLVRYDRALDQWTAVASTEGEGVQGYVTALAIDGDSLYVAGGFEQVHVGSPVAAANVAKFDLLTEQWSPLASATGNGVDGEVRAMALDEDGHLYLAGLFAQANVGSPISAPGLARWDAGMQQWSTPGTPPAGGGYHALIWHQNHLIAGGPGGIRIWSADSGWRTHGGPNGVVYALAATGSDIYAGGYWMQIFAGTDTTIDSGGIGRWSMNEERWFGVGDGLQRTFTESPQVNALAIHDGKLIAGGFFFSSGGTTPVQGYHLLSWNLSAEHWETVDSQLGSGAGGAVSAIATDGPDVLLGGGFGFLGPPEAPTRAYRFGIWRSDLNLWEGSDAGEGQPLIGGAGELTELNGTIYAIGSFGQAGDVPVKSLAQWNGSTWDRVGTVDNEGGFELTAIHAFQGKIYLSGRFSADSGPGLLSGVRLVSWDPASGDWQSIGEFGNDPPEDFPLIYAIKSIGDDLYVGGYFRNVTDQQGTVNTSYLARWNVTTGQWSPVGNDGEGVSQFVSSMVAVGTDLYVGGSFAEVNLGSSPVTAHGVARWDGSQWHSLTDSTGEGTSGVYSLASDGDFLYVGGRFTAVAGVNLPALRVARWRLDGGGGEAMSGGIGNPSPFGNVDFVFSLAAVG
ncbi:MAG: hypothetical protein KDI37_03395, partial [Xanthomonadales bacterium]|nr:hypothetical protein [Xanthomonadales bacterium]